MTELKDSVATWYMHVAWDTAQRPSSDSPNPPLPHLFSQASSLASFPPILLHPPFLLRAIPPSSILLGAPPHEIVMAPQPSQAPNPTREPAFPLDFHSRQSTAKRYSSNTQSFLCSAPASAASVQVHQSNPIRNFWEKKSLNSKPSRVTESRSHRIISRQNPESPRVQYFLHVQGPKSTHV